MITTKIKRLTPANVADLARFGMADELGKTYAVFCCGPEEAVRRVKEAYDRLRAEAGKGGLSPAVSNSIGTVIRKLECRDKSRGECTEVVNDGLPEPAAPAETGRPLVSIHVDVWNPGRSDWYTELDGTDWNAARPATADGFTPDEWLAWAHTVVTEEDEAALDWGRYALTIRDEPEDQTEASVIFTVGPAGWVSEDGPEGSA